MPNSTHTGRTVASKGWLIQIQGWCSPFFFTTTQRKAVNRRNNCLCGNKKNVMVWKECKFETAIQCKYKCKIVHPQIYPFWKVGIFKETL